MALDLSAASLVRIGSGLLLVAVGAVAVGLGRGRRENVAFGVGVACFGALFVVTNLLLRAPPVPAATLLAIASLVAAAGVGLLAATVWGFPGGAALSRGRLAAALGSGAVVFVLALPPIPASAAEFGVGGVAFGVPLGFGILYAATAAWLVANALRARASSSETSTLVVAGCALVLYPAYNAAAGLASGDVNDVGAGLFAAFLLAATVPWLAAVPAAGPSARRVAWVALLAALLGAADGTWLGGSGPGTSSPGIGLVRTAAAGLLAYGILRHRLLGFDFAVPTARRGTVATVALVGFFVVAQVAQEFLSDSMGVLVGGAAAGALLFAAVPLQRAAERLASREPRSLGTGVPGAEDIFRAAVRAAREDGPISVAKERHLADVAHGLGLSARDMVRLRHDVEAEYAEAR